MKTVSTTFFKSMQEQVTFLLLARLSRNHSQLFKFNKTPSKVISKQSLLVCFLLKFSTQSVFTFHKYHWPSFKYYSKFINIKKTYLTYILNTKKRMTWVQLPVILHWFTRSKFNLKSWIRFFATHHDNHRHHKNH